MKFEVKLYDSNGNEIEMKNCICGNKSDTIIQGINSVAFRCNECLYGSSIDNQVEKLDLVSEFRSIFPIRFL